MIDQDIFKSVFHNLLSGIQCSTGELLVLLGGHWSRTVTGHVSCVCLFWNACEAAATAVHLA